MKKREKRNAKSNIPVKIVGHNAEFNVESKRNALTTNVNINSTIESVSPVFLLKKDRMSLVHILAASITIRQRYINQSKQKIQYPDCWEYFSGMKS